MLITELKARDSSLGKVINTNFDEFPVETLVEWRNAASERVTCRDIEIKNFTRILKKCIKDIFSRNKEIYLDIKWIKAINKHLKKRVLVSPHVKR